MSNKIYPNTAPFAHERNTNVNFNYVWDSANANWVPQSENNASLILGQAKQSIHKFGSVVISDKTTEETIWDEGGLYQFPDDNGENLEIKSSNDQDNQEIIIIGLDADFKEQTQSITLTGQESTSITGTWTRVFRAYNNGSQNLQGNVSIHKQEDDTRIYAKILPQNNQTLMAVYTVPEDCAGYLMKYHCSAQNTDSSSSANVVIHIKTREYGKIFRTRSIVSCSTNQSDEETLIFPLELSPKTDIIFNKISSNSTNASINADFDIALL